MTSSIRRLPGFNGLWNRLQSLPVAEAEDSISLRVLVQLLVVVGIIAIDIANPGDDAPMSLWAVPASLVGATYSWYRRRSRNISLKFFLAIGMLLSMAVFFGNIFGNINDTRYILAQLLIQLQVLHSFDLPRRKDLGYSMVIGLILLGVAGTLSQTLGFAPLLLAFLALALPVLILDYRSRLGLQSLKLPKSRQKSKSANFNPKFLALTFLGVIGLGLAIFALMPRFPGYQLRTFPVSAPVNLDDRNFNPENRGIVNPGYNRDGQGINGTSQGKEGTGPGKVDETFYYGFGSKINQNLRGEMKPQVVMRVRSQSPGFWRVTAFDRYNGQGWENSREQQVIKITRPSWSYRFFLSVPLAAGRTQEVIQSYTAVSELPNLIPSLSYPKELYFPTREIGIDTEGSLRSPLGLIEGLTYTVVSEVPYRDRSLLQKITNPKYSKVIQNHYLQIPPQIADKIRQHTQKLLAAAPTSLTAPYEQVLYLTQYLKQHYSLQPELPFFNPKEDLVDSFLFKYEGGYPDHFSTTLTMMLRSIGIPARLVVGFGTGEFNPFTGLYIVKNTDAYAMTEVYFPKYGWFSFDPIPTHPLIPPSIEEDQTFGVLRQFWKWVAGWLPSPLTSWFEGVWETVIRWFIAAVVWLWAILSNGWLGFFTGLILLISLGFLGWLGWNQWQHYRRDRALSKLPPMERLYQQMLGILAAKGYAKHPAQTPLEYARTMNQNQTSTQSEVIDAISHAYVRWRYGGQTPNLKQLQQQFISSFKGRSKSK